jgi:hypothetical protein
MRPSGVEGCSDRLTQAGRICLPLCSGWCCLVTALPDFHWTLLTSPATLGSS